MKKLIFSIFTASFIGSCTNIFPLGYIYLPLLLLIFFWMIERNRLYINRIFIILVISFIFFSLSAIISGIPILLLFSYESLRYDANFFTSYVPLIFFSVISYKFPVEVILKAGILVITFLDLIFLTIYFLTGGTIFFYEPNIYHFLFKTHNAAGGFLSIICGISFLLFQYTKKKKYFISTIILGFSLLLTNSRGSIIALILGLFMFYLYKRSSTLFKLSLVSPFIFIAILLSYTYPIWIAMGKPIYSRFSVPGVPNLGIEREGTIYARTFYHWPRGFYLFLKSPIIGIGYTRYNDIPYKLENEIPLVNLNKSTYIFFNSSHAHNSYIHVAAETGILGLLLLLSLLFFIFTYKCPSLIYRDLLHLLTLIVYISGFVEHRVTTPAEIIPYVLTVGLIISSCNYYQQIIRANQFRRL